MKSCKLLLGLLLSVLFVSLVNVAKADDDLEMPFDLEDMELLVDDVDEASDLIRQIEEEATHKDNHLENEKAREWAEKLAHEYDGAQYSQDPCKKIHCSAGKVCVADGQIASCVCIQQCPDEEDPRRRVCTNKNETWSSDCEVHRQRCLCDSKDAECKHPDHKHIHIDYYGECKQLPGCSAEEMNDFPRRMREWLFNVMRDLANRDELNKHYMDLELEAETNLTRRWANAAVWKWCDLDIEHDRSVSRHELFPIRAPLVSLEHCIAPFLESCDKDDDHRITLKEWGNCLELNEEDMMDRCEDIADSENVSANKTG
jgi:secreted protein acidic and rich in cysteine